MSLSGFTEIEPDAPTEKFQRHDKHREEIIEAANSHSFMMGTPHPGNKPSTPLQFASLFIIADRIMRYDARKESPSATSF